MWKSEGAWKEKHVRVDLTLVRYVTPHPRTPPPSRVQDEDCQMFIHDEDVKCGTWLQPSAQSSRACICGINKRSQLGCFSTALQPTLFVLARRSWLPHAAVTPQRWNNFQYFHLCCLITNKGGGGVSDITGYYLLSSGCRQVRARFH